MQSVSVRSQEFAIDASNVTGAGAVELVRSLLPKLLADDELSCKSMAVGPTKLLSHEILTEAAGSLTPEMIDRTVPIPRLAFRALYCLGFYRPKSYRKPYPLLVLGDIPLRRRGRQVVFVHTPHLVEDIAGLPKTHKLKNVFMRAIFFFNNKHARAFIVQTELMKKKLEARFPETVGRIEVIGQPAPEWVLQVPRGYAECLSNGKNQRKKLKLIYPAAYYPHKNHKILAGLPRKLDEIIQEISLTIDTKELNAIASCNFIKFMGRLGPDEILQSYLKSDALLFLSNSESYGLPLIEAMYLGLPIVAPRLEYVEALCGAEPYYFKPNNVESLVDALTMLHDDIQCGERPNWGPQLDRIPEGWSEVALNIKAVLIETS